MEYLVVSNQAETPNSESDCYMMDYSSLENGMPQKSYGRDAKVSCYFRLSIFDNYIKLRYYNIGCYFSVDEKTAEWHVRRRYIDDGIA